MDYSYKIHIVTLFIYGILFKEVAHLKNIIYITGHRNPDSDSICSALAYAEFKSKNSKTPAMAIRG